MQYWIYYRKPRLNLFLGGTDSVLYANSTLFVQDGLPIVDGSFIKLRAIYCYFPPNISYLERISLIQHSDFFYIKFANGPMKKNCSRKFFIWPFCSKVPVEYV